MKKKGRYIVLLVILLIYFILMFFVYGKDYLKEEKITTKLILGNQTVWELRNRKWYLLSSRSQIDKLNWQKFNVYVNRENIGEYYLWNDDEKWYLFNENKEAYLYRGRLFAYQSNYDLRIKEFTTEKITDFKVVNEVLNENNIPTNQELTTASLVNIDIDNDKKEEQFYLVSNAFTESANQPDNIFSIVFMVKENKKYILYNSIERNKGLNGCQPYINYVLDINDDKKHELILSCARYDLLPQLDMLYKFENNEFKILISNE